MLSSTNSLIIAIIPYVHCFNLSSGYNQGCQHPILRDILNPSSSNARDGSRMEGDMGSIGKMLGMLGCLLRDLGTMLENDKVLEWSKNFNFFLWDYGGIKRMPRDVEQCWRLLLSDVGAMKKTLEVVGNAKTHKGDSRQC